VAIGSTRMGWYFNLGTNGERSIAAASYLASTGKIIVPTFIPTVNPTLANDPCVDDSSSILYFLDPLNGGPGATDDLAAFDVNADGVINSADSITVSGVQVPGFVAGATPITQAGGGQGAILLPAPPGSGSASAISTLAIPDYVWRRQSTREIPAWDANERN
jgi:Tfp pilus tip-associated adhesin PilY1